MDERHLEPEEALPRRCVDQVGARVGEFRERRPQVADLVGHVVHARAPLGEEAADGRVLAQGLEQLDTALSDPHRRRADALVVDGRAMLDLGPKKAFVRAQSRIEILDSNTQMMDPPRFHPREANATS